MKLPLNFICSLWNLNTVWGLVVCVGLFLNYCNEAQT